MDDEKVDLLDKLPQGFREKFTQEILSRTTPADVLRLSLVSKSFHSSANSDVVWGRFIPSEFRKFGLNPNNFWRFDSDKELFLLCCNCGIPDQIFDPPIFRLDKWSGKMCVHMNHKKLIIRQLGTDYWKTSYYGYPVLGHVVWLEVDAKMPTSRLSPNTTYVAYLIFHLSDYFNYGIHLPIEVSVGIPGEESTNEIIYLDPRIAKSEINDHCPLTKQPLLARIKWLEVRLGEYLSKEGESRDLEITLKEVKSGRPKCGVHIAGIEMRPKRSTHR